jgi:hypothetical protein
VVKTGKKKVFERHNAATLYLKQQKKLPKKNEPYIWVRTLDQKFQEFERGASKPNKNLHGSSRQRLNFHWKSITSIRNHCFSWENSTCNHRFISKTCQTLNEVTKKTTNVKPWNNSSKFTPTNSESEKIKFSKNFNCFLINSSSMIFVN